MSFSPEWLALREGADHRARDAALRDRMAASFDPGKPLRIVDLGCGSGSNLRALAPHLPAGQHWRLVDYDPALLAAARAALADWAEACAADGDALHLTKAGKRLVVTFAQIDLNADVDSALAPPADLVTATAFFDLVSEPWIARFCAALAARRLPLFATLTYTGEESWSPPHSEDARVLEAFHADQGRDKGFGPAAGPQANAALERGLTALGYGVATAPSPWRLEGAGDADLIAALADGAAQAVAATGLVAPATAEAWRLARRRAAQCVIGHADLLAAPPG